MSSQLSDSLAAFAAALWRAVADDVAHAVRSPAFWKLPAQLIDAGLPPSKAWLQRHQQHLALWVVLVVIAVYLLQLLGAAARSRTSDTPTFARKL
jgi:hypothetical protein